VVLVETTPSESRYQSIIKLVQQAEKSKAPIVRLADHYSIYFTGVTFLIALLAWFISGDLARVVAVLVVATPCPLLLATPIAIVSGISKAALNGVIVKDGGALETLSRAEVFMFDKTGTLTLGTPQVTEVISYGSSSREEVLHIAASLDQLSTHILARSLKSEADSEHIKLSYPEKFQEHFGDGVSGTIATTRYTLGKKSLISKLIGGNVPNEVEDTYKAVSSNGSIVIFLANESKVLGAIVFQDTLRSDAAHLFKKLSREGIKKSVLLTGDKEERAKSIGETLHLKDVISECLPEDKLKYVKKYQKNKTVVVMVGDGINDAPALAKADVGIALGIHGQTASSDVADIVILSPSVSKTYDVLHIAKKTVYLAKEGIFIGIGASTVAMIFAAFGYIPPLEGTILQEAIDVAVILNALRLGSTLKNA
jgi:heavy metal translocating P-type ATPase